MILTDFVGEYSRYRSLGEKAMAQVSDEALNRVIAPEGNSIAMIVRHVGGNLVSRFTDFLTTDGEKPTRDRDGEFADGTTMAVSYMRLRLDSWYQMPYAQRVAQMYSPQTTPEQVTRFTTDAESNPDQLDQAIMKYGVIGHSQASARARVNGKPVILRRDFDTADAAMAVAAW